MGGGLKSANPTTRDGYLVKQELDASYSSAWKETRVDLPDWTG